MHHLDRTHVKGHREVSSSHPSCPGSLDLDRIVREAKPAPVQNIDHQAIVLESSKYVFGYKTEGTVTQRMAKTIEAFRKYGVTKDLTK